MGEIPAYFAWIIPVLIVILIIVRISAIASKKASFKRQQVQLQQQQRATTEARQRVSQEARFREEQEALIRAAEVARQQAEAEKQRQAQEEARMKKLQQIIKVSTKIAVERIAQVLELSVDETWKRVFDWAEKFQFTIDGDFVIFNKETINDFIASMDKEFAAWHQEGKV